MLLEAIGGGILYYALGFCEHWYHRLMIWVPLALIFSVITVALVG